jgi:hypothetical protein
MDYDGHPSQPKGLYQNFLVQLTDKTILIDIEVINIPLHYNILFGRSYMYAMKFFDSLVFYTIMFPHNMKVINIDQLIHYEPQPMSNLDNILPLNCGHSPKILKGTYQCMQQYIVNKPSMCHMFCIQPPHSLFFRSTPISNYVDHSSV